MTWSCNLANTLTEANHRLLLFHAALVKAHEAETPFRRKLHLAEAEAHWDAIGVPLKAALQDQLVIVARSPAVQHLMDAATTIKGSGL